MLHDSCLDVCRKMSWNNSGRSPKLFRNFLVESHPTDKQPNNYNEGENSAGVKISSSFFNFVFIRPPWSLHRSNKAAIKLFFFPFLVYFMASFGNLFSPRQNFIRSCWGSEKRNKFRHTFYASSKHLHSKFIHEPSAWKQQNLFPWNIIRRFAMFCRVVSSHKLFCFAHYRALDFVLFTCFVAPLSPGKSFHCCVIQPSMSVRPKGNG